MAVETHSGTMLSLVRRPSPAASLLAVAAQARADLEALRATEIDDRAVRLAAGEARRIAARVAIGGALGGGSTRLVQYELVRGADVVVLSFTTADAGMDPAVLDGVAAGLQLPA
jgi:hypothetical protein